MPRSALATQQAVDEGITVAFTAANAAGHSIAGAADPGTVYVDFSAVASVTVAALGV
jgi:hypothetical protein